MPKWLRCIALEAGLGVQKYCDRPQLSQHLCTKSIFVLELVQNRAHSPRFVQHSITDVQDYNLCCLQDMWNKTPLSAAIHAVALLADIIWDPIRCLSVAFVLLASLRSTSSQIFQFTVLWSVCIHRNCTIIIVRPNRSNATPILGTLFGDCAYVRLLVKKRHCDIQFPIIMGN